DPAAGPVPAHLTSAGWLVADLGTGRVIAAKDPHGRYRPASTIKVLLSLAVLDKLDLDTVVEPTVEDWSAEGDSCGMGPRGHYTVRDLLTGLLLVSGNDCAHALARTIGGGSAAGGVARMNEIAAGLHATDTRATSPSGLDAAGMSTSPYDEALIFRAAMANPTFRTIVATTTYHFPGYPRRLDVPGDTDHPGYEMQNSNQLLQQGYPGMIGGKTGYTDDAKKTFVGAVERHGRTIVIVQMYGLATANNSYWTQAESLFDYGFRAPDQIAVGTLADPVQTPGHHDDPPRSSSPTAQPQQTRAHSDDSSHTSRWILLGLGGALTLTLIAVVITGRARGRRR
ncbi:MAG: serine hydrolase, partial [Gordonia sp. (in: high G+C Gram-positive bacteria)]